MLLKDIMAAYRKEHDLSQRQFAIICGLSNGYISMLERGVNPHTGEDITPSLIALDKIATGMGMSLSDLLIKADDMQVSLSLSKQQKEKPGAEIDAELEEMIDVFKSLNPDNRSKLLELAHLFEGDQHRSKEKP